MLKIVEIETAIVTENDTCNFNYNHAIFNLLFLCFNEYIVVPNRANC